MSQFPVKYVHSEMRGAPVVSATPGTRIAALDAFLLTGFGLVTAQAVTVQDGVATATLPSGQSFEPYTVIAIDGATPEALNGQARVLSATPTQITWATSAPNGPATGAITIKVAPVGQWEKVFSGPNKAVYRSTHPRSRGFLFRVDDSDAHTVRVRGYEAMTDVDSGAGAFPSPAAQEPFWLARSYGNASAAGKWDLLADGRTLIAAFAPGSTVGNRHRAAPPLGFGELLPRASADVWVGFVSGQSGLHSNVDSGSLVSSSLSSNTASGIYLPRPASGLGGASRNAAWPYVGRGGTSGDDVWLGYAPNPADGAIEMSALFVRTDGNAPPRADVPGLYYCPQREAYKLFNGRDTVQGAGPLAGRRLLALPVESQAGTDEPRGVYFADITGPWRED